MLDDLTPLRQASTPATQADVVFYQPQTALRLHYPEEFDKRQPVGDNPPPGAIIDYYFKTAPKEEVSLDILDTSGKVVRHLSSKEKREGEQPPEWPDRVERVKTIPANEGMNRFAWDLRYDDRFNGVLWHAERRLYIWICLIPTVPLCLGLPWPGRGREHA